MNDLLKSLLDKMQTTEADLLETTERRFKEVPRSAEFLRIKALPRRELSSGIDLVDRMTSAFSQPWGTMRLRPIQALALAEIFTRGGLVGPIRVGAGKTLISYLAPVVGKSRNPLFVVPASLKKKTRHEFEALFKHWRGPHPEACRIISYELLGRPQSGSTDGSGTMLDKLLPDMIIFDEAHKIKNHGAAVTKRVRRYLAKHEDTKVIAMSGTMTKRSIKDYAHIAEWCLKDGSPVPRTYTDLEAWAAALDEKVQDFLRVAPGALVDFSDGDEDLSAVRVGYRKRLVETPGVIATQDGPMDMSLSIQAIEPLETDPIIDAAFETLRRDWVTPDGHPIIDGITFRRHALEIACGFHYIWSPRPPDGWLEARSIWAAGCRDVLKHNRRGLDSEAQVVMAIDQGQYQHLSGPLKEWRKQKEIFEPNTVPVWHSSEAIDAVAAWGQVGIVWVSHRAFGQRLSEVTGWPYYGRGGETPTGERIEDHKRGPLIASIKSNGTGRNLQKWSKNLIVTPPSSGEIWEQLLGRTHRDGQLADEVTVDVYCACREHVTSFAQALADARYQEDTTGQAQKLLYASKEYPTEINRSGPRWGS